jgi:hypothetical protein
MSEPTIGWISEVVLDGPDPWVLARFWAGLLGGTPVEWYPGWVTLEPPPNGQRLSFQATAHDRVMEAGAAAGRRARLAPAGPRRRAGAVAGLPRPGRPSLLPGHSLAAPVRWIQAVSADSFTWNLIFR